MGYVVVDANRIIAAFIPRGIAHHLLFSGKFKPVGPEKLLEEIEKHKEGIAESAGIKPDDIELALKLLEFEFEIFSRKRYLDELKKALEISPIPECAEYFALALKFNLPIWSDEQSFKKQSKVKILTTRELAKRLKL